MKNFQILSTKFMLGLPKLPSKCTEYYSRKWFFGLNVYIDVILLVFGVKNWSKNKVLVVLLSEVPFTCPEDHLLWKEVGTREHVFLAPSENYRIWGGKMRKVCRNCIFRVWMKILWEDIFEKQNRIFLGFWAKYFQQGCYNRGAVLNFCPNWNKFTSNR